MKNAQGRLHPVPGTLVVARSLHMLWGDAGSDAVVGQTTVNEPMLVITYHSGEHERFLVLAQGRLLGWVNDYDIVDMNGPT